MRWYVKEEQVAYDAHDKALAQSRSFSASEYLLILGHVPWTHPQGAVDFKALIHTPRETTYGADPITLGQDDGFTYFVQPDLLGLHAKNDLTSSQVRCHGIMEMRRVDGVSGQQPFVYGYAIGHLHYQSTDAASARKPHSSSHQTPYIVYYDIVSQFFFLVLDNIYHDDLGDVMDLEEYSDAWENLPSARAGRPQFKVLRLMSLLALQFVKPGTKCFPDEVWKTASNNMLVPFQSDYAAVTNAVRVGPVVRDSFLDQLAHVVRLDHQLEQS